MKTLLTAVRVRCLGLVSMLLALSPCVSAQPWINRPLLGVNLDGPSDYGSIAPYADIMKQARPWAYDHNKDAARPSLDELGNWKPEPGKKPFSIVALPLAKLPGGVYVVTWSGKGEVALAGGDGKKARKGDGNRFEIELPASPSITLEIIASDPADPVRDVHCWLPGLEGKRFNPTFQKWLPVFSTIRFMDWMHTNSSHQEHWAGRPVPEQQTFRDPERSGVPLEYMIDLANAVKANPWFCMPHQADDEYVRSFAQMVKAKLDPSLKIYIEYSNEVWNTAPAFKQTKYAEEKGLAMGIAKGQDPAAAWYAKRSLEIWNIWAEVFGGRERHVRVVAGFAVMPGNAEKKLKYLGDPKLADAIAIAPYAGFSGDIKTGNFDGEGKTSADLLAVVDGQLPKLVSNAITSHARLAKQNQLPLIAYEAGFATGAPIKFHRNKELVSAFMGVTSLPETEAVMDRYLRLWYANGGGLACMFAYVAQPSVWGAWGTMGDYLDQPDVDAPRRRAVLKIAADPKLDRGEQKAATGKDVH